MKKMKVIKDLVHGYIEIDCRIENLISTIHFQRLKDISQLTAQQAYPSATHNRFEHSLGVMHLSKTAFTSLRNVLKEEKYGIDDARLEVLFDHLVIASLLHDVGHAPYSHLGEKYYRKKEIKDRISEVIEKKCLNIEQSIFLKGSSHELMSCYIILSKYVEIIKENFNIEIDFELICRCIVGARFDKSAKWLENLLIEILNSDTIDVDKLDYLVRDAFMTGVSVPNIDLVRLFKNIYVNPHNKKITYLSNALPVIQNIIDARDSLYLWVYNHHTAVYSDFIIEFYIKHQIANFENNKFTDQIDPNKYFSCDAISEAFISNSDLNTKMKESHTNELGNVSNYTQRLFPQIFERSFLKPLWKTLHQYNQFLKENITDARVRQELINGMCMEDNKYRAYIVKKLIEKNKLEHGQIFIVPRSNKFYSLSKKNNFFVHLDNRDINIQELLPQKNFSDMYDSVSFYIFSTSEKVQEIKKSFKEIILEGLPEKGDLEEQVTNLKWFDI